MVQKIKGCFQYSANMDLKKIPPPSQAPCDDNLGSPPHALQFLCFNKRTEYAFVFFKKTYT